MNNFNQDKVTLKRELGVVTSILLVAGLVIGSGVFKKIIPMVQTGIGEGYILLAWAAAGLVSLIGAISVGGLSTITEESGGTYEYFRRSFGKFFAFISGWSDFMIVGTGVNAALAFFFGETINSLITLPDPFQSLDQVSIANFIFPFESSGIKLVGIAAIIILTGVNCIGTRESGVFNNIITSAKILGILILITVGLIYHKPVTQAGFETFSKVNSTGIMSFLGNFLTAMVAALWAYDGWIYATNISGEIIKPKRNLPLALALGIMISMAIYIIVNYVYMRVVPLEALNSVAENEIGALLIAKVLLGTYGRTFMSIIILICVFGALNSNLVSIPRKYYQMAHEGYFFSNAKKIHHKFRTPVIAMLYSMVWSCVLLISGSFDMLTDMVVFTAFVFYGSLCLALIKLKRNGTITTKVIGYPLAPVIFLLFSIALTAHTIWTEPKKSVFGLLLIISSIPFYFIFKQLNRNRIKA